MKKPVLVVHGGAPTAVINASLYGVIREAEAHPEAGPVYAAMGGAGGLLREELLDLSTVPAEVIESLPDTPASAIGTSRDALEPEDYRAIAKILAKRGIRCLLFNGGNGSMDACGKVYSACRELGMELSVVGIPKTIDNDIAATDHAPGYGSAARFIAGTVGEISRDVAALPIHVSVVEAMGRNAGWVAAASALAREKAGDGPHLIYLPERPFCREEFLEDVEALRKKQGGVVVVVSEGLRGPDGEPVVPPLFRSGRASYSGDVSAYLAQLVIRELGVKARSEKPGLSGRASIAYQSRTDREEAILVGREAVKAALEGTTGVMIGLERLPGPAYRVRPVRIPIGEVMLTERLMPESFLNSRGNDVTEEFIRWCRPLIGEEPMPHRRADLRAVFAGQQKEKQAGET